MSAVETMHEKRSRAAQKAAQTRRDRRRFRLDRFERLLIQRGESFARQLFHGSSEDAPDLPTADHCQLCGRALTDPRSVEIGFGRQCWKTVLRSARYRFVRSWELRK